MPIFLGAFFFDVITFLLLSFFIRELLFFFDLFFPPNKVFAMLTACGLLSVQTILRRQMSSVAATFRAFESNLEGSLFMSLRATGYLLTRAACLSRTLPLYV